MISPRHSRECEKELSVRVARSSKAAKPHGEWYAQPSFVCALIDPRPTAETTAAIRLEVACARVRCLSIPCFRLQPQPQLEPLEPDPEPEPEPFPDGPPDSSEEEDDARSDIDWSPPDVQRGMIQPSLVLADQLTPSQILDMRMAFCFLDGDANGVLTVGTLSTIPDSNILCSAHVHAQNGRRSGGRTEAFRT